MALGQDCYPFYLLQALSSRVNLRSAPSLTLAELPLLPLVVVFFISCAGIRLFVFVPGKVQVEVAGPDVLVRSGLVILPPVKTWTKQILLIYFLRH